MIIPNISNYFFFVTSAPQEQLNYFRVILRIRSELQPLNSPKWCLAWKRIGPYFVWPAFINRPPSSVFVRGTFPGRNKTGPMPMDKIRTFPNKGGFALVLRYYQAQFLKRDNLSIWRGPFVQMFDWKCQSGLNLDNGEATNGRGGRRIGCYGSN